MSTRTSRADRNYLGLGANGAVDMFAGTPEARPGTLPDPFIVMPVIPQDWDAVLKAGGGVGNGWTLRGGKVAQGRENSVDCNHVHDNVFDFDHGYGGGTGDQCITTKGGSYNIVHAGVIHSNGRNAHVVVGAWSDQCHDRSHDLDYSGLKHVSGEQLTFILSRCYNVKLPAGAKVLWLKSAGYEIYWWLKFAAVKLHLIG